MCLGVNPELTELEAIACACCRELEELVSFTSVDGEFKLFLVYAVNLVSVKVVVLVNECPCLIVVRTFELPATRVASRIVVGVGTSYERVLLDGNGFAGNHDCPCIACTRATELRACIVVKQRTNSLCRRVPAVTTSNDCITNIVCIVALVIRFGNGQLVACCPALVGIGGSSNGNSTCSNACYSTIGSNSSLCIIG